MALYDKSISQLDTDDLQSLLSEVAVENVRLEFTRGDPDKDESLKKLSFFANTYGGYVIIGAEADSQSGRISGLPGISPIADFKQRLIQWCWDSVSPPVDPFVSDPIPTPSDNTKVCYVVHVDQSLESPHFINSRKGIYVRTNEFSQKFEPQLATLQEVQHLLNRRSLVLERRGNLLERADSRFATFVLNNYQDSSYTSGSLGATIKLAVSPNLPVAQLIDHEVLIMLVPRTRVRWRGEMFPTGNSHLSQHESVIELEPGDDFSLFEANTWGQLYYASEMAVEEGGAKGIHLWSLVGHLLVYLEHARVFYSTLGFNGRLHLQIRLERILNVPFLISQGRDLEEGPSSKLDRGLEFELDFLNTMLEAGGDQIARQLLKTILLGLNWASGASTTSIEHLIAEGRKYNFWPPH